MNRDFNRFQSCADLPSDGVSAMMKRRIEKAMTKTTKTKFAMIKNPQFLANESLRSKLDDPSAFFVSQCILLHMCDLALFAMTTTIRKKKTKNKTYV